MRYIPEKLRSRINAFDDVLITAGASVFSLMMGFLVESMAYGVVVLFRPDG